MPRVLGPILKTVLFTILVPGFVALRVPYDCSDKNICPAAVLWPGWASLVSLRGPCIYFCLRLGICGTRLGHARAHRTYEIPGRQRPAPLRTQSHVHWRAAGNPRAKPRCFMLLDWRSMELCAFSSPIFFVLFYEEPTLHRQFGESYEQYLRTVPRWIPRCRK